MCNLNPTNTRSQSEYKPTATDWQEYMAWVSAQDERTDEEFDLQMAALYDNYRVPAIKETNR